MENSARVYSTVEAAQITVVFGACRILLFSLASKATLAAAIWGKGEGGGVRPVDGGEEVYPHYKRSLPCAPTVLDAASNRNAAGRISQSLKECYSWSDNCIEWLGTVFSAN
jgi:hypothetical protein